MTAVFADSHHFIALLNPRDADHDKAKTLQADLRRPIVTTEYILIEVAAAFSAPPYRARFLKLISRLMANPNATIMPSSHELFLDGLELFEHRPDKSWSLTDCISFRVMEREGLTEALTGDRHFEQAGFKRLIQ
jgi:predicted nucleic acid-binding protein